MTVARDGRSMCPSRHRSHTDTCPDTEELDQSGSTAQTESPRPPALHTAPTAPTALTTHWAREPDSEMFMVDSKMYAYNLRENTIFIRTRAP